METKKMVFGVLFFIITMSILGYFMRYKLLENTPWELKRPGEEVTEPIINVNEIANPVIENEADTNADNAAEVPPVEMGDAEVGAEGEMIVK